ncbi:hypothetical protein TNCV_2370471 [Trichonephila clavipes]|nr:hypothetical protein TNCV_2370471 [Trichonephila clavipes]
MLLPISMFSSPSSSGHTVAWGQRNADYWPKCIEPSLMKPIRTVWLNTLRPVAESNCLCSCVAFSVLFRRVVSCVYRSSVEVARGRPAPGRRLTFLFLESIPQPCNNTSGDSNSVRDTTLCLPGFQSAYNTPCHGIR